MDENKGFLGSIFNWTSHPFQTSGSALNWVLFTGLIIVAIWFWQVVLIDITKEL